ncbi:MAG TPA: hypothetical protein VIX85_15860, partial [Acidimicrobiales bacterium]
PALTSSHHHPDELAVDVSVARVDYVPPLAVPVLPRHSTGSGQVVGRPLPSDWYIHPQHAPGLALKASAWWSIARG